MLAEEHAHTPGKPAAFSTKSTPPDITKSGAVSAANPPPPHPALLEENATGPEIVTSVAPPTQAPPPH
eukprot:54596-Rhodomonas_salina.1